MVGTDRQASGTAEQSGIESLVTLWDGRGMEEHFLSSILPSYLLRLYSLVFTKDKNF